MNLYLQDLQFLKCFPPHLQPKQLQPASYLLNPASTQVRTKLQMKAQVQQTAPCIHAQAFPKQRRKEELLLLFSFESESSHCQADCKFQAAPNQAAQFFHQGQHKQENRKYLLLSGTKHL